MFNDQNLSKMKKGETDVDLLFENDDILSSVTSSQQNLSNNLNKNEQIIETNNKLTNIKEDKHEFMAQNKTETHPLDETEDTHIDKLKKIENVNEHIISHEKNDNIDALFEDENDNKK